MRNFDEDIKRIVNEVLESGKMEEIIRERVVQGFEEAIDSAFKWGELRDSIKKRVNEVLVPFVEKYDMDAYIIKLDTVLTELCNASIVSDNKKILENFRFLMDEPRMNEMKATDLFEEYKKFVAKEMDTDGREVVVEDDLQYEPMGVSFEIEEETDRICSSFRYATIDFKVDEEEQEEKLNRTIRVSGWKNDKGCGWKLRRETDLNLLSLRYMNEFDLLLTKLYRSDVEIIFDTLEDEDYVYSEEKPEAVYQ